MPKPLSSAQEDFCGFYTISKNATAAYRLAYPGCRSDNAAKAAGSRLLTNVNVARRIADLAQAQAEAVDLNARFVIKRLMDIANADRTAIFRQRDPGNGQSVLELLPVEEWPLELKNCVASIKTRRMVENRVPVEVTDVRFADRLTALRLLGDHLGLFNGQGDPAEAQRRIQVIVAGTPWVRADPARSPDDIPRNGSRTDADSPHLSREPL